MFDFTRFRDPYATFGMDAAPDARELVVRINKLRKAAGKPEKSYPGTSRNTLQYILNEAERGRFGMDKPVSEAQRRAMGAAAGGHSTLGISQSVGKEFVEKDPGGKLPARAKDGIDPRDKAVLDDLHEKMRQAKARGDKKEFDRLGGLYEHALRTSRTVGDGIISSTLTGHLGSYLAPDL